MTRRPLTRLAQDAVAAHLGAGDRAVDATVGNGHDTVFLARATTPGGLVIGFDIQSPALTGARARLQAEGLSDAVTLVHAGHERMAAHVPGDWHGDVAAIMFNLGYLPGGDKRVITRAPTTLAALDQALALLRPGGVLSLLLYRGHPGAGDEVDAVSAWTQALAPGFRLCCHDSAGPVLYLVERRE